MFRVKNSLVAAALVIVLVVLYYVFSVLPLSKKVKAGVEDSVVRASKLVRRTITLHGYELAKLAESIAEKKEFRDWTKIDESANEGRDQWAAAYDAVDQIDNKLKQENRKPHFLGIFGKDGRLVARDLDARGNWRGEKLPFKNINNALKEGSTIKDIWHWKNRMMRSAAAPILVDGRVEGAVVVANDITVAEARQMREMFGTQVAFFIGNAIRATSFTLAHDTNREDAARVEVLTQRLLVAGGSPALKAAAANKISDIFEMEIQGERYRAIAGPLPMNLSHRDAGYVVFSSVSAALKPVSRVRWLLVLVGLGFLLVVLVGMWSVARHFVNAEDKLELGVSEVINGNMEFFFEEVEEFEGLANAINVMLARLLGRPEPGADLEDEAEAALDPNVLFIEQIEPSPELSEEERRLAEEPEVDYYTRIFSEYLEARREAGLPVEGITLESLTQKLKANEALLKAKHECRVVRFVVSPAAGKVSLKPVCIF